MLFRPMRTSRCKSRAGSSNPCWQQPAASCCSNKTLAGSLRLPRLASGTAPCARSWRSCWPGLTCENQAAAPKPMGATQASFVNCKPGQARLCMDIWLLSAIAAQHGAECVCDTASGPPDPEQRWLARGQGDLPVRSRLAL